MGNCLLKEQKIILGAIIFTLKGHSVFLQAKVRLVSVKKLLNWLIKLKNYLTQSFHLFSLFKTKEIERKYRPQIKINALTIEIKWRVKVRWNQL